MYVRLTKTVKDKGQLVRPEELMNLIDDFEVDWYYSPFIYGDDAVKYFEEHERSIKGYTGKAYTESLYWDLDCKEDFAKAKDNAIKLVRWLEDQGYGAGIEVFFSGNKGFHIFLHTLNEFNPQETKKICYNVAVKAGVSQDVFDTSVYNVNRIFRIPLTRHQESKLYKIPLHLDQLESMPPEEIRELAKEPVDFGADYEEVDATDLKEEFGKIIEPETTQSVANLESIRSIYGENFNPLDCPPEKRRCIYVLENGYFGSGERENASIRLVAYYNAQGKTREETRDILISALQKRGTIYSDLNPWTEADVERVLEEVYSPNWNGGAYSCRTDEYLKSKCDLGHGCCADEQKDRVQVNAIRIGTLIERYLEYSNEALKEYPQMGIPWVDGKVRFRPRNYSIFNGANGSGKTSLLLEFAENLNKQKIWHIIFSLDMADTSFMEKIGAKHTKYSAKDIEAAFNIHTRNDEIIKEIAVALKEHFPYTLFDFSSSVDVHYFEDTIRALKTREIDPINIQVVFVDYAGRIMGDKDSEYANATEIALRANDVCKRTNTHICFLSQIPREDGDHTMPIRSSRVSKSSGAWEENATIVINCWRPFGNGIRNVDKFIHIYIAKNRSGELGERAFGWDGKSGTLYELTLKEFQEYHRLCESSGKELPEPQFGEDQVSEEAIRSSRHFSKEVVKGTKLVAADEEVEAEISDKERQHAVAELEDHDERRTAKVQRNQKFRAGGAFSKSNRK